MTSTSSLPKPLPPRPYLAVIRTIDRFTTWTGYLFVLLIIPLVFANVLEVFARYFLRDPTVWALDVTTMSYAALFMLGSALALLKGAPLATTIHDLGIRDYSSGRKSHSSPSTFGPFAFGLRLPACGAILRSLIWL